MTAGWLSRRLRATALVWRLTLAVLVAGLAIINATGVYAQLVAAHVGERGLATSAIEMQGATLAAQRLRPTPLPTSTAGWAKSIRQSRNRQSAAGPPVHSRPSRLYAKPARHLRHGANLRVRPLRTSKPSALPRAPRSGRSKVRIHPSATSPSFLAPTVTLSGRFGG